MCRGVARTRAVEAALARHDRGTGDTAAITVVPTDLALAKQVGAILHAADAGTEDLLDAHVVAACVARGSALVLTAHDDDIHRLAASVPAVRIVTRHV